MLARVVVITAFLIVCRRSPRQLCSQNKNMVAGWRMDSEAAARPGKKLRTNSWRPVEDYDDDDDDDCLDMLLSIGETSNHSESPSILESLPDEMIVHCFFGGYMDTMEVLRSFCCVSRKLQQLAYTHVRMLDLRALTKLRPADVTKLASNFTGLSVRILASSRLIVYEKRANEANSWQTTGS